MVYVRLMAKQPVTMRIDSSLLEWLERYSSNVGMDRTAIVTALLEGLRDERISLNAPEEFTPKHGALDLSWMSPEERQLASEKFHERWTLDPETDCWIWNTPTTAFHWRGEQYAAPRFSLAFYKVTIPAGMFACHTCKNPRCVNPDHLWVGTSYENVTDMIERGEQYLGPKWKPPARMSAPIDPTIILAFPASYTEEQIAEAQATLQRKHQ